jgi:hypothetical protein
MLSLLERRGILPAPVLSGTKQKQIKLSFGNPEESRMEPRAKSLVPAI